MESIVVVDNPRSWPLSFSGCTVTSAQAYLSDRSFSALRRVRVFNLCRSYRYQSLGYYVSLLALARRHTPLPSISTLQDMRAVSLTRVIADELDDLIQRRLRRLRTERFVLSIYFGRNVAKTHEELSGRLFRLFQAPLLRATFGRIEHRWRLESIRPIAYSEVPDVHRDFVMLAAADFFKRQRLPMTRARKARYALAVLRDEHETEPPSNDKALQHLAAAGRRHGMSIDFITRQDYARLAEYDALFIRERTQVNHHTYRFARRAAAEGLVVIDDPDSIIKCTNKVYLAELLTRCRIPTPRTSIVSRMNRAELLDNARFPCILKLPDSSFSQGVFKADDRPTLTTLLDRLLDASELLITQEFLPTAYDWRIGVLGRAPLFAAKYYMVKAHWQIAQTSATRTTYGAVEPVRIDDVPAPALKSALRAANAIGSGLYGVDVKLVRNRGIVIEVNDNPNIDAGAEDGMLGRELYDRLARYFIERIDRKRGNGDTAR